MQPIQNNSTSSNFATRSPPLLSLNAPKPRSSQDWNPQHEKLLKQWGEMAAANRWMHYRTHMRYVSLKMWFTLPVIILSSLTGTMNFAQSSFPLEYQTMIPILIGIVNLFMGIITTVGSFLRVSELAEGNRVAALSYGKLTSNIRVEMLLPPDCRTMSGFDFIALCRAEMDRLTEQTPDIHPKVEIQFLKVFKDVLVKGDSEFYTPDIIQLRSVEIFTRRKVVTDTCSTSSDDAIHPHKHKHDSRQWKPDTLVAPPFEEKYRTSTDSRRLELNELRKKRVVASSVFAHQESLFNPSQFGLIQPLQPPPEQPLQPPPEQPLPNPPGPLPEPLLGPPQQPQTSSQLIEQIV